MEQLLESRRKVWSIPYAVAVIVRYKDMTCFYPPGKKESKLKIFIQYSWLYLVSSFGGRYYRYLVSFISS